jgi:hypothetical protein
MPRISINIPENKVGRIRAAFAAALGITPAEVTEDVIKDVMIDAIENTVKDVEVRIARRQAKQSFEKLDLT